MGGIIWAAYLSAVIIKVTFYVTLHPWADILKSDIKSWKWKKSLDEPQIALVKGPRKWKCMAFYDNLSKAHHLSGLSATTEELKQKRQKNLISMPNCAHSKKPVLNSIISIFINARPVTWMMSALCVRRSAIMDMIWSIVVMMTTTVGVESMDMEMNHARH